MNQETGRDPAVAARTKARNAVKLIGNQAHISDLNDKVISLISK